MRKFFYAKINTNKEVIITDTEPHFTVNLVALYIFFFGGYKNLIAGKKKVKIVCKNLREYLVIFSIFCPECQFHTKTGADSIPKTKITEKFTV